MPSDRRPVTLADVAAEAGVSVMTASYAFNQPQRVSDEARARVARAAEALGYAGPDPNARSLRRGRTDSLGVVLGEHLSYAFDDPQAAAFLAGIADVCAERGLAMTILPDDRWRRGRAPGAGGRRRRLRAVDHRRRRPGDRHRAGAALARGDPQRSCGRRAGSRGRGRPRGGRRDRGHDLRRRPAAGRAGVPARPAAGRTPRARPTPGFRDLPGHTEPVAGLPRRRPRYRAPLGLGDGGGVFTELPRARPGDDRAASRPARGSGRRGRDGRRAGLRVRRRHPRGGPARTQDVAVSGWDDSAEAAALGLTTVSQSLREQGATCARMVLDNALSTCRRRGR